MTFLVSILLSLPLIGAYAILAVGIVVIYRASKVLNLAHGAMVMVPPYVVYSLDQAGVPVVLAVVLGIASGGVLGMLVERLFIRPLRSESETAQTVGTVAALGVLIAMVAKVWGTTQLPAVRIFPEGRFDVGLSSIGYGDLMLFFVMLVLTGGLLLLFQKTDVGLVMRGAAENRRAAALMGVDPERVTALAWVLGGSLAAISGIMLASVTNLHPYTLSLQALPAFVAALIGGLGSLTGALWGAAIVGLTQGLVPTLGPVGRAQGAPQLFLALVAIVVMALRGRHLVTGDVPRADLGSKKAQTRQTPIAKTTSPARRRTQLIAVAVGLGIFPWLLSFDALGSANRGAVYALIAVSLVLLTGWVGQISLGHAALVGVGAYATGWFSAGLKIPFPLSIPFAAAVAGGVAVLLGVVAVRVRGLYLAVATLIFSWMADAFLFRQNWFVGSAQIPEQTVGRPESFPFFDFSDRRLFFYVAWAIVAFAIFAASNLRDGKTGRAFFAVRGSEVAAASLGIDVVRTKLLAFSISGVFAGVAGNLIMTESRVVTPDLFTFNFSFFFLAIAVVGGLSSLGGAVAAAGLFASLDLLFFRVPSLGAYLDVISTGLLALVLLAYREGLAALPRTLRRFAAPLGERMTILRRPFEPTLRKLAARSGVDAEARQIWKAALARPKRPGRIAFRLGEIKHVLAGALRRHGRTHGGVARDTFVNLAPLEGRTPSFGNGNSSRAAHAITAAPVLPEDRAARTPLIEATDVTVRFGGLVAVNEVSLSVREHEIVGLIGPNGAGKTTTFNAIAGLTVPTAGRVSMYGNDVTAMPMHERAKLGVARTFQQIQLFPELTVFDNLLVATHLHNDVGLLTQMFATETAIGREKGARRRVEMVEDLLDLSEVADRRAGDLPFGALRMVEVARALVTGFPLIMLDEPASGLDNRETDRLAELLRFVRSLGVTLLLIEHDVKMVTSVSDYMYVLDQGTLIAEGKPEAIKRDPTVIAAYLGGPVEDGVHA